jgi:AraC-like DNA-binding protein
MVSDVSFFLIFFGGSMSWTIAFGELLEREKQTFNYMFAFFMFCAGTVQFNNGIIAAGWSEYYPFLVYIHMPFLALLGPAFYFCYRSVIGSKYHLKWLSFFHAMPSLVVMAALIIFFSLNPEMKKVIITTPPSFISGDRIVFYYSLIVLVVVLVVLGYMVYFLIECSSMFTIRFIMGKNVSLTFIVSLYLVYTIGFLFFFGILASNFIEYTSHSYISSLKILTTLSFFFTFSVYAMSRRDSNYFQVMRNQTEKSRYEKSKIRNLDLELVLSQINFLMTEKKIFCDEDLNLNSFARELEIESYQLSQIVNEKFNKNFNAFINQYRIEESKKMLIEDRDCTIASVSYAVGFNSPATFYEWFCKIAGVSPSKYRKKTV